MISYAQNFEDVLLFRALKHIDKGFYIDVGAQHPVIDSVSLAFYERGWRGIHIEPVSHYARLLREHRPDETVLEVAIAANAGVRKLFEIPDTGLSTLDPEIAQQHQHAGFSAREITVATLPLSSVFDSLNVPHVHWLKIDVEGAEAEVLQSWAPSTVRPWIVVVESTWPNRPDSNHDRWEPILCGFGYVFAFFDGLNRFYVHESCLELKAALSVPANVFDHFQLAETSSLTKCRDVELRLRHQLADLEKAHSSQLSSVLERESSLRAQNAELLSRVQLQEEEITKLRAENARRVEDLEAARTQLAAMTSELAQEKAYRQSIIDDVRLRATESQRQLQLALEHIQQLSQELKEAQTRFSALEDSHNELHNRAQAMQEQLQDALSTERKLRENIHLELAESKRVIDSLRAEELSLRSELIKREQEIEALSEQLARIRGSLFGRWLWSIVARRT